MSEISYQEALEYAGIDTECSSCTHRFLSANQDPCIYCSVICHGSNMNKFKSVFTAVDTGELKMKKAVTIDQVKASRRILERGIARLIRAHAGFTGDNPEITVERILVISEGRRSFEYEVKTK